jgi:signal transduction histidine kinase
MASDLDLELLAAAVTRAGQPVARGRRAARALRQDGEDELAEIVQDLCDDLDAARAQVTRLGLELHDGALQDLAALGSDLHLFRRQLVHIHGESDDGHRLVGRIDDLGARVAALDVALRALASSAQSTSILTHPLSDTLAAVVDACGNACRIDLDLDPRLNTASLRDAQRVALVRIVQSALANVVRHSRAANARVSVRCAPDAVTVEVVDDGVGFDVARTLKRAVQTHRFGLLGMRERAGLLGGELTVSSSDGGPTSIVARLPRR